MSCSFVRPRIVPFNLRDADPESPRALPLPPQPVMRLRIRWLCRRPRFGLPRSSVLRLLPAMDLRGDSNLQSFSAAGCDAPSRPGSHAACRA